MPESETFDAFYARTVWHVTTQMHELAGDDGMADHAIREAYAKAYQQWYQVAGYADSQAWVLATARDAFARRQAEAGGTGRPSAAPVSDSGTWPGIYRPVAGQAPAPTRTPPWPDRARPAPPPEPAATPARARRARITEPRTTAARTTAAQLTALPPAPAAATPGPGPEPGSPVSDDPPTLPVLLAPLAPSAPLTSAPLTPSASPGLAARAADRAWRCRPLAGRC